MKMLGKKIKRIAFISFVVIGFTAILILIISNNEVKKFDLISNCHEKTIEIKCETTIGEEIIYTICDDMYVYSIMDIINVLNTKYIGKNFNNELKIKILTTINFELEENGNDFKMH